MAGEKKKPAKKTARPRRAPAKNRARPEPASNPVRDEEFELSLDADDDFELSLLSEGSDVELGPVNHESGISISQFRPRSGPSGIRLDLPEITPRLSASEALYIDPFEHLIDSRIRRWRLDKGEYGDDLERAKKLVETDPDMALAKCRVTLERCLYKFHEKKIGTAGTKPVDQLIRDLGRKGVLPRKIAALAEVVRELGNVGAHPILDEEDISHREAQIALLALVLLLEWFERTVNPPEAMDYCI